MALSFPQPMHYYCRLCHASEDPGARSETLLLCDFCWKRQKLLDLGLFMLQLRGGEAALRWLLLQRNWSTSLQSSWVEPSLCSTALQLQESTPRAGTPSRIPVGLCLSWFLSHKAGFFRNLLLEIYLLRGNMACKHTHTSTDHMRVPHIQRPLPNVLSHSQNPFPFHEQIFIVFLEGRNREIELFQFCRSGTLKTLELLEYLLWFIYPGVFFSPRILGNIRKATIQCRLPRESRYPNWLLAILTSSSKRYLALQAGRAGLHHLQPF